MVDETARNGRHGEDGHEAGAKSKRRRRRRACMRGVGDGVVLFGEINGKSRLQLAASLCVLCKPLLRNLFLPG